MANFYSVYVIISVYCSTQHEDITIVNTYAPNIGAPKYIEQILTDINKGIDDNTVIVGDMDTPFTSTDISSRQKINKATVFLNDTLEQKCV